MNIAEHKVNNLYSKITKNSSAIDNKEIKMKITDYKVKSPNTCNSESPDLTRQYYHKMLIIMSC